MRFLKPMIAGTIGGAVGALLGAFMNLGAKAYGVTAQLLLENGFKCVDVEDL